MKDALKLIEWLCNDAQKTVIEDRSKEEPNYKKESDFYFRRLERIRIAASEALKNKENN